MTGPCRKFKTIKKCNDAETDTGKSSKTDESIVNVETGFSSYSQMAMGNGEIYTCYDLTQYNKQKHTLDSKPLGALLKRVRVEFSQPPYFNLNELDTVAIQNHFGANRTDAVLPKL